MHKQQGDRSLERIVDSRTWGSFTRGGLRLESVHQEPPHTDVSRKWATSVAFLVASYS